MIINEVFIFLLLLIFSVFVFMFGYLSGMRVGFIKHERIYKSLEEMTKSWMIFYRRQANFRLKLLLKQKLSEEDSQLLKETESRFLDEHEKRFKEAENL